jgi:protein-disulfide isomerase
MGKQSRSTSREIRAAKAAAERRRRNVYRVLVGGGGLVIAGLVIAIVATLVNAARHDPRDDQSTSTAMVTPATATAQGALVVGRPGAPVQVDLYLDYMCPFCGRFERANGGELDRMVADGTVALKLYPLAFLDKASNGAQYSTRAANAIATVADRAPDKVLALNNALFAHQPAEGSRGLSDETIAKLANDIGVPQDVVTAFTDGVFEPWVAASTASVFDTGITGTPTVKINGQVFKGDLYTPGPFTQAVAAAKGRQ